MRTPAIVDGRKTSDPEKFVGRAKYAAIGLGPK
jgi:hypothetical protein